MAFINHFKKSLRKEQKFWSPGHTTNKCWATFVVQHLLLDNKCWPTIVSHTTTFCWTTMWWRWRDQQTKTTLLRIPSSY